MATSCLVLPHVKANPEVDPYDLYAYADYILRVYQEHPGMSTLGGHYASKLMKTMDKEKFNDFYYNLIGALQNRGPVNE
jgi:hypothetical protein